MPNTFLRLGTLASSAALIAIGAVALASCSENPNAASRHGSLAPQPSEPISGVQQAVGSPCTKDLQGLGAIGEGWFGIRTDGSVWIPNTDFNAIGAASERVNSLGTDNSALADMDGEALDNCVLKTNGDIWCWGANDHGQLGDGAASPGEALPVKVVGLPGPAKQVAVGIDSTCALLMDGNVWCWGSNLYGQLGNGQVTATDQLTPVQAGISGVDAISVGYFHACALKGGAVSCWGHGANGEVGNNTSDQPVPNPTQVLTNVIQLSAGGFYTCAIESDHSLWCWGANQYGQLGLGDLGVYNVPTQLTSLGTTVSYVDTGVHATCAIVNGGVVECWGSEESGRLGNGVDDASNPGGVIDHPIPVSGALGTTGGAAQLRESEGAACAIMTTGQVFCWGGGGFLDGKPQSLVPVEIDFCGLPTLDSIDPTFGIYTGGTTVTFTGTEFKAGATVDIGNQAAIPATVSSPTSLTITTPNYTFTDTVDVVVNNPGGPKARLLQAFSFTAPPSVFGVMPDSGSSLGGETVAISGSNFLPATQFDFGGAIATNVTIVDVSNATVTTPAHDAGLVDVTATNPGGLVQTAPMAFTFVAPVSVSGLTPAVGPTAGGTSVTISGAGFDFDTTVQFDGIASDNIVDQDQGTLFATTPPHAAGTVDVVVTRKDGSTFTLPQSFTYSNDPNATGTGSGGGSNIANPVVGNACYCSSAGQSTGGSLAWELVIVGVVSSLARRRRSSTI